MIKDISMQALIRVLNAIANGFAEAKEFLQILFGFIVWVLTALLGAVVASMLGAEGFTLFLCGMLAGLVGVLLFAVLWVFIEILYNRLRYGRD